MPRAGPQSPHWPSDTTKSSLTDQGVNCKVLPGERVIVTHLFLDQVLDLSAYKL